MTPDEREMLEALIDQALEARCRDGRLIKTRRMHKGKPIYVAREYATEEELKAAPHPEPTKLS
jgi:hypothetical protein